MFAVQCETGGRKIEFQEIKTRDQNKRSKVFANLFFPFFNRPVANSCLKRFKNLT